jgi:Bromodomain
MTDFMQRHCKRLLQSLMDRHFGHVFNAPVDTEKYPNYLQVVDKPMDFGTIRSRIDSGGYASLDDFVSDVNLVLANARKFNAQGSLVHQMADALQVRPIAHAHICNMSALLCPANMPAIAHGTRRRSYGLHLVCNGHYHQAHCSRTDVYMIT